MAINSGFPNQQYEDYYNKIIFRIILVLQKRLLQAYQNDQTDEQKFKKCMQKLLTNAHKLEQHKYKQPRFSQALQDLQDFLEIEMLNIELALPRNPSQEQPPLTKSLSKRSFSINSFHHNMSYLDDNYNIRDSQTGGMNHQDSLKNFQKIHSTKSNKTKKKRQRNLTQLDDIIYEKNPSSSIIQSTSNLLQKSQRSISTNGMLPQLKQNSRSVNIRHKIRSYSKTPSQFRKKKDESIELSLSDNTKPRNNNNKIHNINNKSISIDQQHKAELGKKYSITHQQRVINNSPSPRFYKISQNQQSYKEFLEISKSKEREKSKSIKRPSKLKIIPKKNILDNSLNISLTNHNNNISIQNNNSTSKSESIVQISDLLQKKANNMKKSLQNKRHNVEIPSVLSEIIKQQQKQQNLSEKKVKKVRKSDKKDKKDKRDTISQERKEQRNSNVSIKSGQKTTIDRSKIDEIKTCTYTVHYN